MTGTRGADPKRPKRIIDKSAGLEKVDTESRCRICGTRWPLNRHHLVPRSLGGDDVDANLVILDGSGTSGCHGKIHAGDLATRSALRLRLRDDEIAYITEKRGDFWLERKYPLPEEL